MKAPFVSAFPRRPSFATRSAAPRPQRAACSRLKRLFCGAAIPTPLGLPPLPCPLGCRPARRTQPYAATHKIACRHTSQPLADPQSSQAHRPSIRRPTAPTIAVPIANKPTRTHDTPQTHSGPHTHTITNTQPHTDRCPSEAHGPTKAQSHPAVTQPPISNHIQTAPRRHRIIQSLRDPETHSSAR